LYIDLVLYSFNNMNLMQSLVVLAVLVMLMVTESYCSELTDEEREHELAQQLDDLTHIEAKPITATAQVQ